MLVCILYGVYSTEWASFYWWILTRMLARIRAMKLSIGIVGLPNVGKSTLFKHLTEQDIVVANYPFATIDPNVGIVQVPDERLDQLTELSASKKKVPAVVEFYDIAGLVKGASAGEGLGNQFLTHIRETNAIAFVLRVFSDSNVMHVEGDINPVRDLAVIETELQLKDLETVTKRLGSLEKEMRAQQKDAAEQFAVLTKVRDALEAGEWLNDFADEEVVINLQLLSAKPRLFVINGTEDEIPAELKEAIAARNGEYVVLDLGSTPDLRALIRSAYTLLGLASFFTTGDDETRAWTIRAGASAPEAAGAIHTDFEKKFIRAEVVSTADLLASGGWTKAKGKGLIRLEGKEYKVADGDVLVIRHG
jgi:ribosome-binding ATPase